MSAWGDMMRRGAGEETRAEDTISFDKPGPDYVVYDMNDFKKHLKRLKNNIRNWIKRLKNLQEY